MKIVICYKTCSSGKIILFHAMELDIRFLFVVYCVFRCLIIGDLLGIPEQMDLKKK